MQLKMESTLKSDNLFQIPILSNRNSESEFIGVIDSSGSMSSYWPYVVQFYNDLTKDLKHLWTITFSRTSSFTDKPLINNIQLYEGSNTNISCGFERVNQAIKTKVTLPNITILFISDGEDSTPATLEERMKALYLELKTLNKKINFITIGVGTGFPTFLAMRVRDMYHNGQNSIPPVFLIQKPLQQQEWKINFEEISTHVKHAEKIKLKTPVQLFPWSTELTDEVYQGTWVLSSEKGVLIQEVVIKPEESFTFESLTEIFQVWVSQLQLTSLKDEVQKNAIIALKLVNDLKDQHIQQGEIQKKVSFQDRMEKKFKHGIEENLYLLIKEIKNFSENNILGKLTEQEAAQRLAIGTKVGKYHNQALRMRGITINDYIEARDHFIQILETNQINPESSQEPSIIILQNQKEIFLEEDLIAGLKICPTQYDLIENLPLVGRGVLIARTNSSMISPFNVHILEIAQHHQTIDTVSIQQNGNEMKLSVGLDDQETVNAVIPLFGSQDKDLKPLLRSRLFNILMTFNLMQNADTCFETAYIALLAALLVKLVNQEKSEWRDELIGQVKSTMEILFSDTSNSDWSLFCKSLLENSRITCTTEHPDIKTKCQDSSKAILGLFCLLQQGAIKEPNQVQEILKGIFCQHIGRIYPSESKISNLFDIKNKNQLDKLDFSPYVDQILKDFPKVTTFYTQNDIKQKISSNMMGIEIQIGKYEITLNKEGQWFISHGKLSFQQMQKIFNFFLNKQLDEQYLIIWLYHASLYKKSYERNKTPVNQNFDEIYSIIQIEKSGSILESNPVFNQCWDIINQQYQQFMAKTHVNVFPMSQETLIQECKKIGIDHSIHQRGTVSGLIKTACQSIDCPFYLQYSNQLNMHLAGDSLQCPAFHKSIKENSDLKAEEIYQIISQGKGLVWDNPHFSPTNLYSDQCQKFLVDEKNLILDVIEQIRVAYVGIK